MFGEVFKRDTENKIFKMSELAMNKYWLYFFLRCNRELESREKFDYRMGFIHGMRVALRWAQILLNRSKKEFWETTEIKS